MATLLKEVCKDIQIEPQLQEITGEILQPSTITGNEARLDICARGFWQAGQMAFFDVRVFNPTAKRYVNQEISKTYEVNEIEKKKLYEEYCKLSTEVSRHSLCPQQVEWVENPRNFMCV